MEQETNIDENTTTSRTIDPQVEERAKVQGWVPKEEFRGDPANWRPADEFVKRADEMMPIMKSVNKKLESQVGNLTKELSDTKGMIQKMVKIQSKYSDDFYDSKISDLKTQKLQAVKDGDIELYVKLENQESGLKKPENIEISKTDNDSSNMNSMHPEVQRWIEENSKWFGYDKEMTDYAMFAGEQMKNENNPLALPGQEYAFCEEVKRRVQATFPGKFKNPNQNRTDLDESNLRGGDDLNVGDKKTWNDLPTEAKQQCQKLLNEIPGYTKEKYIQDYYEGE
jgi:hypothetical protein